MSTAVLITRATCLFVLLTLSVSGCATRRDYRSAYQDMRNEVLHTEQQYFELEERYRIQQAQLNRIRQDQGLDPIDEPGANGESESGEQLALNSPTRSNRARNASRRNSNSSTPWLDEVNSLKSDAGLGQPVEADEILAMIQGGDGDSNPRRASNSGAPSFDGMDEELAAAINSDSNQSSATNEHQLASVPDPAKLLLDGPEIDTYLTHLVVNSTLTRGADFDDKGADDGIALVIEPRNNEDLFVPIAGPVLVSLIDPAETGQAQRIGLWQFERQDIEERLNRQMGSGRGITILLPWPEQPPKHSQLKVFVRYETEDGRFLEASADVMVAIAGDGTVGWTVRTTPRRSITQPSASPGLNTNNDSSSGFTASANFAGRNQPNSIASGPTGAGSTQSGPADSNPKRPEWRPYR